MQQVVSVSLLLRGDSLYPVAQLGTRKTSLLLGLASLSCFKANNFVEADHAEHSRIDGVDGY